MGQNDRPDIATSSGGKEMMQTFALGLGMK